MIKAISRCVRELAKAVRHFARNVSRSLAPVDMDHELPFDDEAQPKKQHRACTPAPVAPPNRLRRNRAGGIGTRNYHRRRKL